MDWSLVGGSEAFWAGYREVCHMSACVGAYIRDAPVCARFVLEYGC